jgi:hypothetical protein
MRKLPLIIAAATALVGGLSLPASAQTTAYAPGQGASGPTDVRLSIPVTASVGGRCGFAAGLAPSGNFNQSDFDVVGLDFTVPFSLECTGPSRVAVVSLNGGLKTTGAPEPGYAVLAPYNVSLSLVGSSQTANATCSADTLVAGSSCAFLGPASTTRGLRLASTSLNQVGTSMRITAAPYTNPKQLVQGTYSDTLIVTISASP